jgi:hypothetical protein
VALYSAFFYLIIIMCVLVCVYFITIYRNPNVSGEIYDIQASKLRAWALIGVPLYVLIGAANGLLIRALYGWFPALFDRPERPGAQRTRRSRPERYDL